MGRRATLVGIGCAALGLSQTAAAAPPEDLEPEAASAEVARLGFALAPTLAVADNCSRHSDVVGCESGRAFLGFELSALFPLLPELSLGPYIAAGFDGGSRGSQSSQFSAAGAELRLLPFAPSSFWLSARAGVWGVRDAVREGTEAGSEEHVTRAWAPSAGIGLGFDVSFAASYGLSFAWFVDYVMLSSDGALPEDYSVDWSAGPWFTFGLGMYFDL